MQQATATRPATILQIDRAREASPPGVIEVGRALHGMKHDQAVEWCDCLIDIAAALFNVSGKALRQPGRATLDIARVRQIAMYVGHVVLRLTMSDVGRGFGRDRTTVLYACHLIEDMRDDADFDRIVATMERVVNAAFRERGTI